VTLEDSIHSHRLRVLREAERSGNVSETCRQYGMSRTEFAGCGGAWNSTARRRASQRHTAPESPRSFSGRLPIDVATMADFDDHDDTITILNPYRIR